MRGLVLLESGAVAVGRQGRDDMGRRLALFGDERDMPTSCLPNVLDPELRIGGGPELLSVPVRSLAPRRFEHSQSMATAQHNAKNKYRK